MEWKKIPMEYFWASFFFSIFLLKSWALMYSNKSKKKKRQITIAFKHLGFSCFLLHCLQCSYRERVNIFWLRICPLGNIMFPTGYFIRVNKLFYPKQVKASTAHVFSLHIAFGALQYLRAFWWCKVFTIYYLFSIKV